MDKQYIYDCIEEILTKIKKIDAIDSDENLFGLEYDYEVRDIGYAFIKLSSIFNVSMEILMKAIDNFTLNHLTDVIFDAMYLNNVENLDYDESLNNYPCK